ncbi:MAG: exonuclease SbcCD subunit D [Aquificaceae bacterium]
MRLLHVADLHAGKRLYDRISRKEDLIYALEQIKRICKEEKVEVLLIAGDVFDKRNPDFESQEVILEFLTEINSFGLHTLLITGNHDSYDFMKIYKSLRKLANIYVFDRPSKNIREAIFEYGDLKVACLPYPDERVITHLQEEKERSYAEKVSLYMKALAKEVRDARYKMLMAHIMLDKAKVAGSEVEYTVSPAFAVRTDSIPEEFDYVALGHVHRNQRVVSRVYYAGSTYQIDFSERGMDKFVNLLVLEDGLVRVNPIRLDLKRKLVEVNLKDGDDIAQALEPLAHMDVLVKVYLSVRMGDPFYNYKRDLVAKILEEKLAKLEIEPIETSKAKELRGGNNSLNLIDLYIGFYKDKYKDEPSESLKDLLKSLINKVSHEAHTP